MADILHQPRVASSVSIIPYYIDKGKQTFLLGTKSASNRKGYIYTDFGGKSCAERYSRHKETPLQCGLRHLRITFEPKDIHITHVILLNKHKPYRIIALSKMTFEPSDSIYEKYLKRRGNHPIKSFEWKTANQLKNIGPRMLSDTLKEFRLYLKKDNKK